LSTLSDHRAVEPGLAYCAACDRPVRVLVRGRAAGGPGAEQVEPAHIVCLEHGETCNGAMCPIFDLPSEQMRDNLEAFRRAAEGG
jgi:hypothetical protein